MKISAWLAISFLFISGCSSNHFQTGHKLFLENNYVSAIEQFDQAIDKKSNGARATKAEIERSESYHQLALLAYEKNNWILASRLFFLSNSLDSDQYLDNCYYQLSQKAFANGDIDKTLDYYNLIINYLTNSEYIPEIYYKRIKMLLSQNNEDEAISDFASLWKDYRNNEFTQKAKPLIDNIIPNQLELAISKREQGEILVALDKLFVLAEYFKKDIINKEIAISYIMLADREIADKNYSEAYKYFIKSYPFDEKLKEKTQNKVEDICMGFINDGDQFLATLDFEKAITTYSHCFEMKSEYQPAIKKIAFVKKRKVDAIKANELFKSAEDFEYSKKYENALTHYQQSKLLVNSTKVKDKIFCMKNMIKAKKNPKEFALNIILDHKNGKLAEKIYEIENSMNVKYGTSMIESSGWKVLFSSSNLKYDVRYDILSSSENYYFVWKVDLRTQEISALNKRSEEILK